MTKQIIIMFFLFTYLTGNGQGFNFSENFKTIAKKTADNRYLPWSSSDSLGKGSFYHIPSGEIYLYDTVKDTCLRITNNYLSDNSPKIDGDYILWNGSDGKYRQQFLYCISTRTTKQISHGNFHTGYGQICGKYVVWDTYRNALRLRYYDIERNKEGKFATQWDMTPRVSGCYVVTYGWKNVLKLFPFIFRPWSRYDNTIIRLHNLETNKRKKVKITGQIPKIKGDYCGWGQYIYSISGDSATRFFPDSLHHHANQGVIFITDKVVLCQGTAENSNLYRLFLYHIATHELSEIPNSEFNFRPGADHAFLTENYVVWLSKERLNGKNLVYLYNLTDNTTEQYELPYNEMKIIFRPIR